MEHIQDGMYIPNFGITFQDLYFLFSFLGQFRPELRKSLKLINELVNDLPQPLVW